MLLTGFARTGISTIHHSQDRGIVELRLFLSAVARSWYIAVGAVVLGVLIAVVHLLTTPAQYQSSARLYVNVKSATSIADLAQANSLAQQLAADYAQLADTRYVLRGAAASLGGGVTASELGRVVTAVPSEDTAFLTITAAAGSGASAARTADAVAQSLINASRDLSRANSSATRTLELREVQPAEAPAAPASGTLASELPLGAAIGLVLGVLVIVLRDRFDTRPRSIARVAATTGAAVLGTVPGDRRTGGLSVLGLPTRSPQRYESFRALRTALDGQGLLAPAGVSIAVTSSVPDEGKSSTIAGLAIAIAASGRQVVVIEADLRRPRIARAFGVQPGPGLSDVLRGNQPLEEVLHRVPVEERISVVTSGSAVLSGAELLESPAFVSLVQQTTEQGAVVLIDTPPLLTLSDASAIARHVDHLLLVVGPSTVKDRDVERAVAVLRQVKVAPAGVVVNRVARGWDEAGVATGSVYGEHLGATKP